MIPRMKLAILSARRSLASVAIREITVGRDRGVGATRAGLGRAPRGFARLAGAFLAGFRATPFGAFLEDFRFVECEDLADCLTAFRFTDFRAIITPLLRWFKLFLFIYLLV